MNKHDLLNKYVRVGAYSPDVCIGDPRANMEIIEHCIQEHINDVDIMVFPELCISGYTCADLFNQTLLIDECRNTLRDFVKKSSNLYTNTLFVLGMPIRKDNLLFNTAVYVMNGKLLGFVPKMYLPNYNEFYEKRWFVSADKRLSDSIIFDGEEYPFTPYFLIRDEELGLCVGTDICEDLWMPLPPSSLHMMYGANVLVNLSASNETISKHAYRRNLVVMQSARCMAAYVYASAGHDESTTDLVFSGHKIIANNGRIMADGDYHVNHVEATIDLEKLAHERARYNSFSDFVPNLHYIYVDIHFEEDNSDNAPLVVDPYPFVPSDSAVRMERCEEIFGIQSTGLAQRMKKCGTHKLVVGISGGLDSTLAVLVAVEAMKQINESNKNIICITMPGFGTTKRTHDNSKDLMTYLGVDMREVDIKAACLQHFDDIGHDASTYDVTYENVQARERTQILMDVANKEGALVVGTGDLSELALGWCTYNGDHMSMYAVNTSIPKTLVRYIIESLAEDYRKVENTQIADTLDDICDTPISPELLPTDASGNMVQKTEDSIGKYDLHDFFLFHMLRNGFAPRKIYELAILAFPNVSKDVIKNTMSIFYRRFFTQQFKRSCLPDSVKVGSVAVSPRGDLRMPSDASMQLWMKEVENLD